MVVSVSDSFVSLAWTVALLTLFTFVFAVFLTQLVADFLRLGRGPAVEEVALMLHFGSLQSTMLSLYEASTGGINWHEIVDPLMYNFSPAIVVVFLCYMFFVIFALTNVVTGVFVESALRTAEEDKRRQLTHQMTSLFTQADDDGSGTITWDEFQEHLAAPQLQSFLKALDLHVDEARALFQLLDVDDSGEIDADELVQGCLRLHGQAKAIELAAFMHDTAGRSAGPVSTKSSWRSPWPGCATPCRAGRRTRGNSLARTFASGRALNDRRGVKNLCCARRRRANLP
ncbi:unnamed protein product [Prorocentrum cordatum]|uniref:EF-hand domain-containing protein n=1 Tax=Prorocentrum cordatum TaxID=2364126 RepID=A0ABN9UCR2_9DINO|nr:unnamed protein product [Polarella glacialis]